MTRESSQLSYRLATEMEVATALSGVADAVRTWPIFLLQARACGVSPVLPPEVPESLLGSALLLPEEDGERGHLPMSDPGSPGRR